MGDLTWNSVGDLTWWSMGDLTWESMEDLTWLSIGYITLKFIGNFKQISNRNLVQLSIKVNKFSKLSNIVFYDDEFRLTISIIFTIEYTFK